jgi:hypothetical protein
LPRVTRDQRGQIGEDPENPKMEDLQIFDKVLSKIKLSAFDPPSKRLCRVYRSLQRAVGLVPSQNKIF